MMGIQFSGPMVTEVLAGRKTQTRRVGPLRVRLPQSVQSDRVGLFMVDHLHAPAGVYRAEIADGGAVSIEIDGKRLGVKPGEFEWLSRYGGPGDEMWMREAFASPAKYPQLVAYRATGECGAWAGDGGGGRLWVHHGWIVGDGAPPMPETGRSFGLGRYGGKWRSPMFMPRALSRATLRIVEVRVERLQDITIEGVIAEGVKIPVATRHRDGEPVPEGKAIPLMRVTKNPGELQAPYAYLEGRHHSTWTEADYYRAEFAAAWDRINGKRAPWSSNPWVQVITFWRRAEERS